MNLLIWKTRQFIPSPNVQIKSRVKFAEKCFTISFWLWVVLSKLYIPSEWLSRLCLLHSGEELGEEIVVFKGFFRMIIRGLDIREDD
jgi:hypothetical protein